MVTAIPTRSDTTRIAYDSSNGCLYVTGTSSGVVSVINGSTNALVGNISVGAGAYGITFDPSNGYLYVGSTGGNTVTVIDGAT